ncbi:hypothetical protein WJX82_009051 [Trebouxia sp. C0006]
MILLSPRRIRRNIVQCQFGAQDKSAVCMIQCGDVLGSALAVVMALEQAVLMDRLDERSQEVPEVFAEAVSTIELAQALVQNKVAKDEKPDGLCRFAALNRPVLLPSGVQQHGMKKPTSSCLRQGCKCHHVQCILYIDPVAEHQSLAGLGQVWWTLRDDSNSTVFAHDVAKGVTTELPDICSDATVSCLGLDRAGRVWMGCQGGQVQVWCPVFQRPICHGHALSAVSIGCMAGAEEPDCMWLGTDNGCISHACLSMTTTNTGSQPIVTLFISFDQSIGQNTLISGQAGLDQRSFVSHGSESTNPRASSSAKTHVLCPRVTNSSQHTASRIRQQQSGGTPVMGLKHTSNMDHSPWYDDQPEDTAEHSLGSTSAQPSPYSTALARAGRQQQMQLHPGPMSMQSQVGSANQPCRLAHDGPVHEIMVLNDRVVTRGGREQSVVMKEWTPNGELIETHSICKQGPITCMTALHQPPSHHNMLFVKHIKWGWSNALSARDSEQEPDQELDNALLDDQYACSGATWFLQRFLASDSGSSIGQIFRCKQER